MCHLNSDGSLISDNKLDLLHTYERHEKCSGNVRHALPSRQNLELRHTRERHRKCNEMFAVNAFHNEILISDNSFGSSTYLRAALNKHSPRPKGQRGQSTLLARTSRDRGNAQHLPLSHRRAQRDNKAGGVHGLEQQDVIILVSTSGRWPLT